MNFKILGIFIFASLMLIPLNSAFAHPHSGQIAINSHTHESKTDYVQLGKYMQLEKTTLFFHAPIDNQLPWGFVEGKITNHVPNYPVIIQIFQDGQALHFAQTNVLGDGSYEYKFRVLNHEDGNIDRIFNGNYIVKIFKVVYLNYNELI